MAYQQRGHDASHEINPRRHLRDTRPMGERVSEKLQDPVIGFICLIVLAVVPVIAPALADVSLLIGMGLALFIKTRSFALPIKLPKRSGLLDPNEVNPATGKPKSAEGVFYLGNKLETGEEIWISERDSRAHMAIIGTTGSGKTEALLGLCQNALIQGSGFMFVDGKAHNKTLFKIYDLLRKMGREDDLLVMNFMTGARDITGAQPVKLSNTTNPFAQGSSGMLIQIVVGLMSSSQRGDDMWKDRAISFVESLLPPLVYLRDHFGMSLNVNEIRRYFELERVEELAWSGEEKYPGLQAVLEGLRTYLVNLPGYDRNKFAKRGGQSDTARDQHGYITMQLTRAFTSLADTYGHIVRTPMGEIDFKDVVLNRRILVVLLPSLEKSQAESANLGKLVIQALKGIMVEGLGSEVEGDRKELEEGGVAAMPAPFTCILDEYGYYAVKGFAVAFAQARGLGFSMVIGAQDLASLQRESKEEATSVLGNTGVKWFGKIEDPDGTMDFVLKRSGKANATKTSGFDGNTGLIATNYADNMNATIENVDRVNVQDIYEQIEGQFHIVWRSRIIRMASFYVNPKPVRKVRLNHFVMVTRPDAYEIEELEMSSSGLIERLMKTDLSAAIGTPPIWKIDTAVRALEHFDDLLPNEKGVAALVAVSMEQERYIRNFRAAVQRGQNAGGDTDGHDDPELYRRIVEGTPMRRGEAHPAPDAAAQKGSADVLGEFAPDVATESQDPTPGADDASPTNTDRLAREDTGTELAGFVTSSRQQSAPEQEPDAGEDIAQVPRQDVAPVDQMNIFVPPKTAGGGFGAEVFQGEDSERARRIQAALTEEEADDTQLLDYSRTFSALQRLERDVGASEEQAASHAKRTIEGIEEATTYPRSVPPQQTPDDMNAEMNNLLNQLADFL